MTKLNRALVEKAIARYEGYCKTWQETPSDKMSQEERDAWKQCEGYLLALKAVREAECLHNATYLAIMATP